MKVKEAIKQELTGILFDMNIRDIQPEIQHPVSSEHGDYSTNIAMILGKKLGKNPMELAEQIVSNLKSQNANLKSIERIEVVKPGFINLWLSKEELFVSLQQSNNGAIKQLHSDSLSGKRIMVEYAHPNTHKEMHIGHMRTLITGEALSRLFEFVGAKVFRANYQGDIGPHVAKALYGAQKLMEEKSLSLEEVEKWSNKDKAHFLGQGYVKGSQEYEEHKEEIDGINAELYAAIADASSVIAIRQLAEKQSHKISTSSAEGGVPRNDKMGQRVLYQLTRQWSLDYYSEFYARFYTHFDRLFFESEMTQAGREIVMDHIDSIFVKENGAVIFPGEKHGLHTRVFITQAGNPTYEGKEMGNAFAEYKAFPFDLKMHIVASEQAGYFQVVFKALELIDPEKFVGKPFGNAQGKQHHLSMGMVTLTDRKMSSRTGDILTVDWLIDQVKTKVEELAKEGKITRLAEDESKQEAENPDETIEMITIGAIKYSVLKGGTGQNVAFDIEKSVSLDGNSAPYLQYTYARTQSVLTKSEVTSKFEIQTSNLEPEELMLLRTIYQFEDTVITAAEHYSPNILCTYLFDLAQQFNLFYQKHKIIGGEQEAFRLALTASAGKVLQKGLDLLGIKSPEQM